MPDMIENQPHTVEPILRVERLVKQYAVRRRTVHAVSDVSFDVMPGETLGLVGESGCGKSTVGRAILQLPPPTSGRVVFEGHNLCGLTGQALRAIRPRLQMVFQDPISSLNPRRHIADIVAAPLTLSFGIAPAERDRLVREMLEAVGLEAKTVWSMHPHELSGGQCQRVSLARALILKPRLIVCDEAVSSLDVSVQAQILNLLEDMKARFDLSLLFIAHDLAVVKNISDRIAVMYLGKLCEIAPSDELYAGPRHPYTKALLSSIPSPDPKAKGSTDPAIEGDLPSPFHPPSGCRFRTRCPRAQPLCTQQEPPMRVLAQDHFTACHFPLEAS
ncbi:MAG: ATP-binding cassette domain-containing protein [Proteobacteria bacterium]|nr:ATP-binding cassette domain-containing protein [Pseudomonadota bacterium]